MILINRHSLGTTLDSISEALFFEKTIPSEERTSAAQWIASCQGKPGAYAGMFAPAEQDMAGIQLFTGERVRSRVGIAHLLGEEACRILTALEVNDPTIDAALGRAIEGMIVRLAQSAQRGYSLGSYCCSTCSTGYWRNLAINLFPRSEERLQLGMLALRQARRDDGRWHRFPFFYTSLVLTEIGLDFAKSEMLYAAPCWRRLLPRLTSAENPIVRRRAAVGQRLLELCETKPN